MALTRTLLTGNYDNTDATSYTTASISPTANTTLYLFYMTRHGTTAPDMTPSGVSGITWTRKTSQLDGISLLGVWEGVVGGSPGTGALTLSMDGGVTAIGCSWHIEQVSGADQAAPTVQSVLGATGSTGTSGTITYAAASAAGNRFFSFFIHRANEATNPRTNWTELDDRNGTAPNMGSEVQWRDDGTNETTGSASWTTSARWQGLGIEVKAATASTVDLAGQADGTSSDSGDLILNFAALVGQTDGVSSDTGDMTLNFLALNGSSDGVSSDTGDLSILGLVSLAGSSDGLSSDSGDVILNLALVGSADGVSTATGLLSLQVLMAGSSDGTSSDSGTLTDAPLDVITVMLAMPRYDMIGRKVADYRPVRKVGHF